RNQGVGSWELNLAGFLTDLNTNIWSPLNYNYRPNPNQTSLGFAFIDANDILRRRYGANYQNLASFEQFFNLAGPPISLATANINLYSDQPLAATYSENL